MSEQRLDLTTGCVVITGGGGLLGRALSLGFAARGAAVVVADLDLAAAQAVAKEIRSTTRTPAIPVQTDVGDPASMQMLAEVAVAEFDQVRVLCNNAGRVILNSIDQLTHEDWRSVLDVQLFGVINGVQAFLPHLRADPERSHILNTASMSGVGKADLRLRNAPYVTAKFAVVGLSETLRPALAGHNIGVSVLCPGYTVADPGSVGQFKLLSAAWYRDNLLTPAQVATETLHGIDEDRLHIFPHHAGRQEVVERHELLMRGFDQAELSRSQRST